MLEQNQLKTIKNEVKIFFEQMTLPALSVSVGLSSEKQNVSQNEQEEIKEVVDLDVKTDEPQILIGQQGQTLFEIQRILRMILNKKLQKSFYINLDINEYKKKKIEYLKNLAKSLADQVAITKEQKVLLPMSSYERRVIHAELSQRADVVTESQGDGFDRHVIIRPR